MRLVVGVMLLGACGDNSDHGVAVFRWDGDRAPGAYRLDHLAPDDADVRGLLDDRQSDTAVAMVYGHLRPGKATAETVEAVLARAVDDGLPFLTFADLAAGGPARRGVCLSFDDDDFAGWTALRPVFARYGARVTFFVTRYQLASPDEKVELRTLADDGHDIEAHSLDHVNALDYVAAHGLPALLADQVLPSLAVLEADGYAPVAYAHPFGATDDAIDAAILEHVALVRRITTP